MIFNTATQIAYRNLLTTRGEQVAYGRASESIPDLMAIPAIDEFSRESQDGLTAEERTRDFLIQASKLVLSSVKVEPEPGDEIEWQGKTYEVLSPGGNVPAWRYEGAGNYFYRVHTREI